ncbi:GntR family transcriptional regulator [Nocardioides daphniae]|uniref:GntR family transcriptional regulator n=1 Tax=Nocardioides daphniae TaxID=402297 RepID=A0A4P7UC63_9ACTN|nr:GntR family transcriptional regulator [Nocardioides daphniae]QCC77344.1 GntR family transcriptional regulator [Nocardioides daphniae]GGD25087.1 GntR family transcriptional regulator [Nocardioides daphniae]
MTARTDTRVRSISHRSLVDRVTEELQRAILNGDIAPGSTISIVELCKEFDVSHIPVREALRRLESEGVVSLRPGRSAVVASLSADDLSNIYSLRKLIEADLVVKATPRLDAATLERADAAMKEYATIEREASRLAAAHHAFHAAFLDDVLGTADRRVLELLWTSSDRYLHLLLSDLDKGPEKTQARIDEHQELLELARAGRTEELRDAWVAHLDSSEQALLQALAARDK